MVEVLTRLFLDVLPSKKWACMGPLVMHSHPTASIFCGQLDLPTDGVPLRDVLDRHRGRVAPPIERAASHRLRDIPASATHRPLKRGILVVSGATPLRARAVPLRACGQLIALPALHRQSRDGRADCHPRS